MDIPRPRSATSMLLPLLTQRSKWASKASMTSSLVMVSPLETDPAPPKHIPSSQTNNTSCSASLEPTSIAGQNLLLLLPGEIRNTIYRLVLTAPEALAALRRLVAASHRTTSAHNRLPINAALVQTCRQVYAEASPILYGENIFGAHPSLLNSLPHLVDPARPICAPGLGRRIRRWYIHVRIDCDARFHATDAAASFDGADYLDIEASQAMFRSAGMAVLLLFAQVRGVKAAHVRGSVSDPFARWLETVMMSPPGTKWPEYEASTEADGLVILNGVPQPMDPWTHANR